MRGGRRVAPRARHVGLALAAGSLLFACASLFDIEDDACEVGTTSCAALPLQPVSSAPPDTATRDAGATPEREDAATPPHEHEPMSDSGSPDLPEPSPSDAGPEDPCDTYCERVTAKCVQTEARDNRQYATLAECRLICPLLPRASEGAPGNDTLECRASFVDDPEREPDTECPAAGRGGGGTCGSSCESYCGMMEKACPAWFELVHASEASQCVASCEALDEPANPFSVEQAPNDGPNAHCLLWHVGKAIERGGSEQTNIHCAHAAGRAPCGSVAVNAEPLPEFR